MVAVVELPHKCAGDDLSRRPKIAGSFGENDREEEQAAVDFGPTILRHNVSYR